MGLTFRDHTPTGVVERAYLRITGVAPGARNSRTATLYKSGIATSLSIQYNSADIGDKIAAGLVNVNGGDLLEIRWTHAGNPIPAQAAWSAIFYSDEPV